MLIYVGAVMGILYYLGITQVVASKLGWLVQITMGTTAIESLSVAGNIFLNGVYITILFHCMPNVKLGLCLNIKEMQIECLFETSSEEFLWIIKPTFKKYFILLDYFWSTKISQLFKYFKDVDHNLLTNRWMWCWCWSHTFLVWPAQNFSVSWSETIPPWLVLHFPYLLCMG